MEPNLNFLKSIRVGERSPEGDSSTEGISFFFGEFLLINSSPHTVLKTVAPYLKLSEIVKSNLNVVKPARYRNW